MYSLAHHPFQGRHPFLVAPGVPGVPVAQGQPVHRGSGTLSLQDPGRRRGRGLGATYTFTCPLTTTLSCVLHWAQYHTGTHKVGTEGTQTWTSTGFRLVTLTLACPAHTPLMLWPQPPSHAHLMPGTGMQRKVRAQHSVRSPVSGPEAPAALGPPWFCIRDVASPLPGYP